MPPRSSSLPLSAVAAVCGLLTLQPASAEVVYGSAQGGLQIGGERFELRHAYALHVDSVFESRAEGKQMTTVVLVSDKEVDRSLVGDFKRLAAAARKEGFHAVEVRIQDDTGEVLGQRLYRPGEAGPVEVEGGEGSLWLRGEYTNKEIWGAVGSDGELKLGDSGTWRYEAFFAALFPEPPSATLTDNKAVGTFKLAGRSTPLAHARAYLEAKNEQETYTVVILSSAPVELQVARDEEALGAAARESKLSALKLWIHDQEGAITRQLWVTPQGLSETENLEGLRWGSWEFTHDVIRGFVTSDGPRRSGKSRFEYEAHFAAPIEKPDPPSE